MTDYGSLKVQYNCAVNAWHYRLYLILPCYDITLLLFVFHLSPSYRLSIPNMEDLKKRILKIVSNCNKPKVRPVHLSDSGADYNQYANEENDGICVWTKKSSVYL